MSDKNSTTKTGKPSAPKESSEPSVPKESIGTKPK